MNKNKNEKSETATAVVEPKRYDDAFKRQAVEHWLRSGKNGTQIAQELGISYPRLRVEAAPVGMPSRSGPIWKWRIGRCGVSWRGCASSATS